MDIPKKPIYFQANRVKQMEKHVPGNEEVKKKLPPPNTKETLDLEVPHDRIVKQKYDKENDDDPRVKDCDEFLVDDKFL